MTALRVQGLRSGYGKVPILAGVDLLVAGGEVVAVVGPNGSGKSTLLKTICGLIRPYSGQILFDGRDMAGRPSYHIARAGISYVPEGGRLFPNMTVRENLLMGAFATPANLKSGLLEEIYTLFPILQRRGRQYAATLSGGEKQMLAISRGLVSSPKILMLDEPSLGIAPKLVEEIYDRLHALKAKGLTVLLVEQNTNFALELADRAYVLENGRIVLEGSGQDVAANPEIKRHFLGL
ncbi:MAG: branched-chain amino acid ABC transporter ATP-binding protein [Spirochaetes bacterium RBG_16_67_19]|nr:MAG: branched-chain amino acid ABC transporter ATP-binding protein [Spirochaetes bacterium GWB1_66_5]OHD74534.1 MAG: branched-chain amino acid ABC transporter ATP-binding protein [Spirochaetes bacterium RBG_16_67_19]